VIQTDNDALVREIILNVAELPDRTSPDDWPEAMLVTADELETIVLAALRSTTKPLDPPARDEMNAAAQDALATWLALPEDQRSEERPWIQGFNAGWEQAWDCRLAAEDDEALRKALRTAIGHIEHMAAWISKQKAGYSFASLGEDMPDIRAALAATRPTPQPKPLDPPAAVVDGEELGRFGHHPEAGIDYEIEIDALIGMAYDRLTGMLGHLDLEERIRKAMEFRVMETPLELRWLSQKFNGTREIYTKMPDCIARLEADRLQPAQDEVEVDALRDAYWAGAMAVHNAWVNDLGQNDPDFGEAASDYAQAAITALRQHQSAEIEALRAESARFRTALEKVRDKWLSNNCEGDDYEEGYDDGLKACRKLARAALKGGAK